jgi:hypothetical protein
VMDRVILVALSGLREKKSTLLSHLCAIFMWPTHPFMAPVKFQFPETKMRGPMRTDSVENKHRCGLERQHGCKTRTRTLWRQQARICVHHVGSHQYIPGFELSIKTKGANC